MPVVIKDEEADAAFFRRQLARTLERYVKPGLDHRSKQIADIGCGKGYWLEYLQAWTEAGGAVYGLDRDATRLQIACTRAIQVNVVLGDACALPWPDASFDLISQFVVFTSVLRGVDRQTIAAEMKRVLKPGGLIIWYDFFAPNPLNRRTKRVGRKELATLFPDCRIRLRRVTLLPPLARFSLRVHYKFAEMLDALPWLRTHYLAVIEPEATAQ